MKWKVFHLPVPQITYQFHFCFMRSSYEHCKYQFSAVTDILSHGQKPTMLASGIFMGSWLTLSYYCGLTVLTERFKLVWFGSERN